MSHAPRDRLVDAPSERVAGELDDGTTREGEDTEVPGAPRGGGPDAAAMATVPVPGQVVLALVLLPGYVLFRVALHFDRFAGPVDWSEYERAALSLVGNAALLAGTGAVFPGLVAVRGVGADVASEAATVGLDTTGEREVDLPVVVSEGPLDRAADRVSARGTVRNELDAGIEFVQVRIDFEDTDGARVGTAVDSFDRSRGGDAWRSEAAYATGDPEEVASYSVGGYAAPSL